MSSTRVDLPDPDTPVTTTSRRSGMATSMPFRLCSVAPRMTSEGSSGLDARRDGPRELAQGLGDELGGPTRKSGQAAAASEAEGDQPPSGPVSRRERDEVRARLRSGRLS